MTEDVSRTSWLLIVNFGEALVHMERLDGDWNAQNLLIWMEEALNTCIILSFEWSLEAAPGQPYATFMKYFVSILHVAVHHSRLSLTYAIGMND